MTSPRVRTALEVAGLLAAPVLVFFALGVQGMTNTNIEDAHFYQAYAEHGDDLMLRLGDYRYYWVRLAFILPARVSYDLFGAVTGFFVWRYVLVLIATVPAYLLLRRLYGIGAGAVAVAAVLSSPVLIYAWGTDYPDSSAVSYLIAGTACLFMPVRGRRQKRGRLGWLTLAGIAYTLAAHSQFISGPLVVIAVLAYLAMVARSDWRAALRAAGVLVGCAAVVTGLFSLISLIMWDRADILYPTWRAALHFRTPNELRKWHSPNWHWFLRTPYLLVPYLVPLLWGVVARFTPRSDSDRPSPELGLAVVAMLQMLLFTYLQFWAVTSELEYHVYSSMLWSSTLLVLSVTVVRATRPLLATAKLAWIPAALVLLVPYTMTVLRGHVEFELVTGIVVSVALLIVVGLLVRLAARAPRWIAGALATAMIGTTYLLTTAEPPNLPYLHSQRHFPEPDYAHALRNNGVWHAQRDAYVLAAHFNRTMPQATKAGQQLLTWFEASDQQSSDLSAQYLWTPQSLSADLPEVSPLDVRILKYRRPQTVVMLGRDDALFPQAVSNLEAAGFPVTVSLKERLTAGAMSEQVWVLTLGPVRNSSTS